MVERSGADTSPSGGRALPLYTIVDKRPTGLTHDVVLWVGYGPVAPTLWTTNGSIRYVARLTADYVRSGYYRIENAFIEADFSDARSVAEALRTISDQTNRGP